ncbi:hypothetical protein FC685_22940 [Bacillus cereus]|uniref:hypothetical protein n=1 Tax=Bacillus cereus TaxID=1396 RepID=UPI0010BEE461|nr:hypothetical protein [Bacillus cereus]TKH86574.1 hypothetical protein FC685_22940 [Bacillus cereus]
MTEQCPFERCDIIITGTQADKIMIDKTVDAKSNLLSFLAKSSYQEFKDNNAFGLNFPLPTDPPIMVGADMSEESYNQMQSAIVHNQVQNMSNQQALKIIATTLNPEIAPTWLTCMTEMMQFCKDTTTNVGISYTVDRSFKQNIIKIKYIPFNEDDPYPVITSIHVPDSVECRNDCLTIGMKLNREFTILFERVKPGAGTIIIGTNKGSVTVSIVPDIPESEKKKISELIGISLEKAFINAGGNYQKNDPYTLFNVGDWKITDTLVNITMSITKIRFERTKIANLPEPFPDIYAYLPVVNQFLIEGMFDLTDPKELENKICSSNINKEVFGISEFCIPVINIANAFFSVIK